MTRNLPAVHDLERAAALHQNCLARGQEMARVAVELGQMLHGWKAQMKHGEWMKFLTDMRGALGFEYSTANAYMKVAEIARGNPNFQTSGNLSIKKMLKSAVINPRPKIPSSTGPSASRAVRGQNPSSSPRPHPAADEPDAAQQHAPSSHRAEAEEPASLDDLPYRESEQHEALTGPAAPAPASLLNTAPEAAGEPGPASPTGSVAFLADNPEHLHNWRIIRPWLQTLLDADTPTPSDLAGQIDFDDVPAVVAEVEDGIEFLRELEGELRKIYGGSDFDPRSRAVLVDPDEGSSNDDEMEL